LATDTPPIIQATSLPSSADQRFYPVAVGSGWFVLKTGLGTWLAAPSDASGAKLYATTDETVALKVRFEQTRILPNITIHQDMRAILDHGPKPAQYQRYIVLHDTEGLGSPQGVISWWAGNGNRVAAHFVVGRDGEIWQCVPLDRIAHHAGYAPNGYNARFGISDDGRDDMLGTARASSGRSDYGMNAWSIGIEMVHVGGGAPYTTAQLEALDGLIAYIDAYFGLESTITDHKAWAVGNSDTSPEFAQYLRNYQSFRRHAR
jgi:N-acetyl-anhydromuramyl-L-alanine amidase AmpD